MALNFLDWNFLRIDQESQQVASDASARTSSLSFLARRALSELLKKHDLDLILHFDETYGFPYFKEKDGSACHRLFCSLSHTEGAAVAALSNFPIGIDIEKKDRSVDRVLKKTASIEEIRSLDTAVFQLKNEVVDPRLLIWVGKEALAKASGLGLRKGLLPFRIYFGEHLPFKAQCAVEGPTALKNPVITYHIKDAYLVSIAYSGELI